MAAPFLRGIELSRRFYVEAVRPVLRDAFPGLAYAAALIGPGSEVLGYDTARSADHDWGPRLQLFGDPEDAGAVGAALRDRLPASFLGYPTSFPRTRGGPDTGVEISDLTSWFARWLGFDPRVGVTLLDWLATPTQRLRETVSGVVFHDGVGALRHARAALAWYPDDVWRYVLGCQWARLGQEEAFVGRAGEVGDELGSRILATRLARDAVRLSLLMCRQYPSYSKWLGTDLGRYRSVAGRPDELAGALGAAVAATSWPEREEQLCRAYSVLAEEHNSLGLTEPIDPFCRPFFDRPFRVIDAGRFAAALFAGITDPRIRDLPRIGAVDQFVDSTDASTDQALARAITAAAHGLPAS